MAQFASVLRFGVLASVVLTGCDAPVDLDLPSDPLDSQPTRPSPSDTPTSTSESQRALEALQRLHDRTRGDARVSENRRLTEEAEKHFAERGEDPGALQLRFSAAGTPDNIGSPTLWLSAAELELAPTASPRALADGFVRRFAGLWEVSPAAFETAEVTTHEGKLSPRTVVRYAQRHQGLPVVGGQLSVLFDTENPDAPAIIEVSGAFLATEGLAETPSIEREAATESVQLDEGETTEPATLVVWSGSRSGGDPEPRLAWRVPVGTEGNLHRQVFIDALTGDELAIEQLEFFDLQRSLFDMRSLANTQYYCQNWTGSPSCGSHCDDCATDLAACALCTCPAAFEPLTCDDDVWRYEEAKPCLSDNDPAGELDCDASSQLLWDDAKQAYDFWKGAFGRDSWDDAGGWMHLIANVNTTMFGGIAFVRDLDSDGEKDVVSVAIRAGAAGSQLHGHELGHMLQYGMLVEDGPSFHNQEIAAREHNADAHSFRYRGLSMGAGYNCSGPDLFHYTRFLSANTFQANKFIGNCHGWLMHQPTGTTSNYGVSVTPMTPSMYDQVWYANLKNHHSTSDSLFDWWNDMIQAAADVYGFTAPYFTAVAARDAIGGWTDVRSVSTGVQPEDRYAAATIQGNANTPCVFYRYSGGTEQIAYSCRDGAGWTTYANFNDTSVDPAASEPTATYRYENGTTLIYVAWAGTDDRIHYRTFDPTANVIGPAQDMGAAHQTDSAVAIAPVLESGAIDRLVVVYHPLAHPTWFYWTYVGSTSPGVDMGPAFDSDADPALVPFPYYSRLYFVRPDSMSSPSPGRLRYTSYTMAGGWESATDLTALFESDSFIAPGAVTSDRGVALTVSGRTANRLRMTWVTPSTAEIWYATLSESSPGVLERDDYRAVPLAPTTGAARSAGGLAPSHNGYPLFHFSGRGSATAPKLYESRMYSD